MDAQTRAAIEAIGTGTDKSWELKPSDHVAKMSEKAAPLRRILELDPFQEIIAAFETADRRAVRMRNRYKWLAGMSAFFSLAAVLIAALVLFLSARSLGIGLDLTPLIVTQGIALLLSFVLSLSATHLAPFEKWMSARAEAEFNRILYFNRIFQTQPPNTDPSDPPLLPLKLEYFRHYQLDVQKRYYSGRGREHAQAERRSSVLRYLALVLVLASALPFIATLAGVRFDAMLSQTGLGSIAGNLDTQERFFIALSTSGAALQGWLAALGLMNQDQRNAARYAATARNLDDLSGRPLDDARVAAVKGEVAMVQNFLALVQEQISSEHREWVSLRSVAPNMRLDRLSDLSLPPHDAEPRQIPNRV